MKDEQITLRLPGSLRRRIARAARARRVPQSQLVREAVESYLAADTPPDAATSWARVSHLAGSIELDHSLDHSRERDALARQLRAHNWRERE